jgi:hypothetical protein
MVMIRDFVALVILLLILSRASQTQEDKPLPPSA